MKQVIDNICYSLDQATRTATVCPKKYVGDIVIPATVAYDAISYRVTNIGAHAFWGCVKLTSITIPSKLISIGRYAFAFSRLISITIPDSVTSIGESAFSNCENLASVIISNSVISIGEGAFSDSGLTSIVVPDSVANIGEGAFGGCDNLTQIVVEQGNPTYDSRNNCNAIIETATNTLIAGCKSSIIPNGVTCIWGNAFGWCEDLASIDIPNSVTSIGDDAFCGTGLTSIIIPDSVTGIGDGAFSYCTNLASITIPNSVISIGESAFDTCALTSIVIPDSVTSIGEGAFGGCNNLRQITVAPWNPTYDSRNNCNAIIETATNTLIAGCQNTIIPNGVTSIGDSAFSNCENLTSIIIPTGVISIGEGAFYGCGLTSIIIPDGVTSIGELAFEDCESLISITLPASIEEIGERVLGWHDDNQHTICYVPQGMTEKFCKMGLKRWRKQIVEINPQDDKDGK